jgi:hypothetical protein
MKRIALVLFFASLAFAQAPITPVEPSQIYGACAGVHGLSPAKFYGCYFTAQHIGTGAYMIEISDLVKLPDGTLGTSVRLEASKTLATFGPIFLAVAAGAGAAEGNTGSATTALGARPMVGWNLFKSPFTALFGAQLLSVAGSGQQANISLAITFSH